MAFGIQAWMELGVNAVIDRSDLLRFQRYGIFMGLCCRVYVFQEA
jgi:hypothetical protein